MLLAVEEHERSYGLQEKSLRKLLINSLKISGSDAKRLEQCNENEISDVVYEIVKTRSSRESQLTVEQVDGALNRLCENQKQQFQQKEFEYLFLNGSASDLKWIVRIVLKSLRIKISINKILDSYHPLASALFKKFNQLSKVCEIIENGNAEESVKDIAKPFIPIRPMLSQKFSVDMNNMLGTSEFYQEIKLDGERFQLHMENGTFKYYSRNAHEYTDNFNILLSPLVKFKPVIHSIILDGEMIIWNKSKQRFVTKGETDLDVKKIKDPNLHLRPCYCAFDVLYMNGISYLDQPYSQRCEILSSLFDDQTGIMVKTKPVKIRNAEHLVDLFNQAMQNEEEGIILKKADSFYMPGETIVASKPYNFLFNFSNALINTGEREKGGWYKIKADYFDGELVKDFDCVIVAGKFQNPHKKDYIRTFQVGTIEKVSENNFKVFVIGEVTHGLSVANRMKLNEKLSPYFIDYRGEKEIDFEKGRVYFGREKPDVFIPPHKSIVLQIRVSELAPSYDYYTSYTFRFPRIVEIRFDKFWDDSTTLKEFKDTHKTEGSHDRRVKKVNQRVVQKDDIVAPSKKRKILSARSKALDSLGHDSDEEVEPIDNVLEGKEFCVLTTSSNLPSIRDLKLLLRTHGGIITENPRENKTFAIVAGELRRIVKNYMDKNVYNVIKAEWIVDNMSMKKELLDCPELCPTDFYSINSAMKDHFSSKYDEYGDSFTDPIKSVDELHSIVRSMDTKDVKLSEEDIEEFEKELYSNDFRNPNIFRGFTADFYDDTESNYFIESAKSIFKYRAGMCSSTLNDYVFVDKQSFKNSKRKEFNGRKLIDYRYILDSNDVGKLLDTQDYFI